MLPQAAELLSSASKAWQKLLGTIKGTAAAGNVVRSRVLQQQAAASTNSCQNTLLLLRSYSRENHSEHCQTGHATL